MKKVYTIPAPDSMSVAREYGRWFSGDGFHFACALCASTYERKTAFMRD